MAEWADTGGGLRETAPAIVSKLDRRALNHDTGIHSGGGFGGLCG